MELLGEHRTHRAGPGDRKGPHRVTEPSQEPVLHKPQRERSPPVTPEARGAVQPRLWDPPGAPSPPAPGSALSQARFPPAPGVPPPRCPQPRAHRQPSTPCAGSRRPAREDGRVQPGCGPRKGLVSPQDSPTVTPSAEGRGLAPVPTPVHIPIPGPDPHSRPRSRPRSRPSAAISPQPFRQPLRAVHPLKGPARNRLSAPAGNACRARGSAGTLRLAAVRGKTIPKRPQKDLGWRGPP